MKDMYDEVLDVIHNAIKLENMNMKSAKDEREKAVYEGARDYFANLYTELGGELTYLDYYKKNPSGVLTAKKM